MINVLIVEDEQLAVQRLQNMLEELEYETTIAGVTDSIEGTVRWLSTSPPPDLILMDIELADGQSFEIFRKIRVSVPVIFITSYDEYAIRAFKVNSVDYLLKPLKRADLHASFEKFITVHQSATGQPEVQKQVEQLIRQLASPRKEYRDRFLVKSGQSYFSVESSDISYFYSEAGLTRLMTWAGKDYLVDYNLDELEDHLDPRLFFRANRQFLVHVKSVKTIHTHFNHKLKVILQPASKEELIVSREKAMDFKIWMGK